MLSVLRCLCEQLAAEQDQPDDDRLPAPELAGLDLGWFQSGGRGLLDGVKIPPMRFGLPVAAEDFVGIRCVRTRTIKRLEMKVLALAMRRGGIWPPGCRPCAGKFGRLALTAFGKGNRQLCRSRRPRLRQVEGRHRARSVRTISRRGSANGRRRRASGPGGGEGGGGGGDPDGPGQAYLERIIHQEDGHVL